MERNEIFSYVRDILDDHFEEKDCPVCDKEQIKMLKFSDDEEYDKDKWKCVTKYRCLRCLNVFTEELKKV